MEIGIFQLENLILTQARFQFLVLGEEKFEGELDKLAARGQRIAPAEVLAHLKNSDKNFPVILLGGDVKATAAELEGAGYGNVYWVGL